MVAALAALGLFLVLGYWAWPSGERVVFEGESAFGRVRVVERTDGLRSLYTGAGRARQSAVYPGRPTQLELAYTRTAMIGPALTPRDGRILFVGLGGGAMPMYTRAIMPEARIDVVEIDSLIVDVARRHFGFRPDSQMVVHTGDGRAFIENAPPGSYDLIVLDAFSDDAIPSALTTWQFLEAVRTRLAPGGVVVSNLWTSADEYAPMLATYDAVFEDVHLVRVGRRPQRILIGGSGQHRQLSRSVLIRESEALAERVDLGFDLPRLIAEGYEKPPELLGRWAEAADLKRRIRCSRNLVVCATVRHGCSGAPPGPRDARLHPARRCAAWPRRSSRVHPSRSAREDSPLAQASGGRSAPLHPHPAPECDKTHGSQREHPENHQAHSPRALWRHSITACAATEP